MREREARTLGNEARDPRQEIRQPHALPGREVDAIDVRDPRPIRYEEKGAPVGGPLRGDVRAVLIRRDDDLAALHVEDGQAQRTKDQLADLGSRSLVGRVGDLGAVGRPDRIADGVAAAQLLPEVLPVRVGQIEHRPSRLQADEGEARAVRRPRRGVDRVEAESEFLDDLSRWNLDDVDRILAAHLRRDRDLLLVRGPCDRGVEEAQCLEAAGPLALDQLLGLLPVERGGQVDIVVHASIGDVDVLEPRRGHGRRHVEVRDVVLGVGQLHRDLGRGLVIDDLRQVFLAHRLGPLLREHVDREPGRCLQGPLRASQAPRLLQDLADLRQTVVVGDKLEDRLTEAVDPDVAHVAERPDRDQVAFQRRVPQPHRRVGIDPADRQILGHPLHEPDRDLGGERIPEKSLVLPEEDIHLKRVHELVGHHVIELGVRTGEREEDAPLQELGDAAGADPEQLRRDVRLLEVGMGSVEDERNAVSDLVM